jgi:hypothetical protein
LFDGTETEMYSGFKSNKELKIWKEDFCSWPPVNEEIREDRGNLKRVTARSTDRVYLNWEWSVTSE